jgi:hypothetical protein
VAVSSEESNITGTVTEIEKFGHAVSVSTMISPL